MSLKIETPPTRAQVEEMRAREDREMTQKLDEERASLPFRLPELRIDEAQRQKLIAQEWEMGKKTQARFDARHEAILKKEQDALKKEQDAKRIQNEIAMLKALRGTLFHY